VQELEALLIRIRETVAPACMRAFAEAVLGMAEQAAGEWVSVEARG